MKDPEQPSSGRELLLSWLHLAVLWAFAVAQPLFGVLSDSPEFFVARDNTSGDIVLLALATVLVPPTLLVLLELPLVRAPAARRGVHFALVSALASLIVIQVLESLTDGPSVVLIPVAALVGVAAGAVYARSGAVRSALTILAPVPLVFAALFLFTSDVSPLVLPQDEAEARGPVRTRTPIVVVVFDEFNSTSLLDRRHRINAERFPNFSELADRSTWYPNATSVAGFTPIAVPAILTGRRSERGTLPIASELPENLFSFLGPGHEMNVEEPVTALCPEALCGRTRNGTVDRWRSLASDLGVVMAHRLAPKDLEGDLPSVDESFEGFADGGADSIDSERLGGIRQAAAGDVPTTSLRNRSATFARFLSRIGRTGGRPPFAFLHIALPHVPWEYLPSGQRYEVNGPQASAPSDEIFSNEPRLARQSEQRYLLQVGYTDHLLGRLMRRLRSQGLWDESLVVVTADHGLSFKRGTDRRVASPGNLGEIAPVPLFIKEPGQPSGRIDRSRTRTVEILPKMAEILGLRLPWRTDPRLERVQVDDVSASYAKFDGLRQEALDRELGLFGEDPNGVYTFGMNDLAPNAAAGDTSVLVDGAYTRVDPHAHTVPAFVTGFLSREGYDRVGVVVNGRAAGVGPTRAAGPVRFSAVINPATLREGRNQVEIVGIDGGRVVRLQQEAPETYRLAGGQIRSESGEHIRIESGAISGLVEGIKSTADRLRVNGWAARKGAAAERILVFADGAFVVAGRPLVNRPDVAEIYGRGSLGSGYELFAAMNSRPRSVRVFAVIGNEATELPRFKP